MEKDVLYKREVRFRDANKDVFKVTIKVREIKTPCLNWNTLEKAERPVSLSFIGECGTGSGQIDSHIVPRTQSQETLLNMWREHHCTENQPGTKKQTDYLKERYHKDYHAWYKLFRQETWYSGKFERVREYDEDDFNRILRRMCGEYSPEKLSEYFACHNENDYYVKQLIMLLEGVYEDRGYKYGSSSLYKPLPHDADKRYKEVIDHLCHRIEEDEREYTDRFFPTTDVCAKDFDLDATAVKRTMEQADCDEREAKHILALCMLLEYSVEDVLDMYERDGQCDNLYIVGGYRFYAGTSDELDDIARNMVLNDPVYVDMWKEEVRNDYTTYGLDDWRDDFFDQNGFAGVLNNLDGSYHEFRVGGEDICICRN